MTLFWMLLFYFSVTLWIFTKVSSDANDVFWSHFIASLVVSALWPFIVLKTIVNVVRG